MSELLDEEMTNADSSIQKAKGRGGNSSTIDLIEGEYDTIDSDSIQGEPIKSIEGWIVFLTGVHEEAEENELLDCLSDYGSIKNFQLQLDRRTGFVKGYALVEYEKKDEAEAAIKGMNNTEFMEQTIHADWAFVSPKKK